MADISDGTHKDLKMALLSGTNLKIMESETQRERKPVPLGHQPLRTGTQVPASRPSGILEMEDHMLCEQTPKTPQHNPRRFR